MWSSDTWRQGSVGDTSLANLGGLRKRVIARTEKTPIFMRTVSERGAQCRHHLKRIRIFWQVNKQTGIESESAAWNGNTEWEGLELHSCVTHDCDSSHELQTDGTTLPFYFYARPTMLIGYFDTVLVLGKAKMSSTTFRMFKKVHKCNIVAVLLEFDVSDMHFNASWLLIDGCKHCARPEPLGSPYPSGN